MSTHPSDLDLDIERERIDLAIAQGAGEFPRHRRWRFVDEEVFPVCSPRYLERHGAMTGPPSLTRTTLLHLEERYRPRLDWTGPAGSRASASSRCAARASSASTTTGS